MNSLKIAEKYSMVVGKLYQKDNQIYGRRRLVKFINSVFTKVILLLKQAGIFV